MRTFHAGSLRGSAVRSTTGLEEGPEPPKKQAQGWTFLWTFLLCKTEERGSFCVCVGQAPGRVESCADLLEKRRRAAAYLL